MAESKNHGLDSSKQLLYVIKLLKNSVRIIFTKHIILKFKIEYGAYIELQLKWPQFLHEDKLRVNDTHNYNLPYD